MLRYPGIDKKLSDWIIRTARKHYWRVAGLYDLDDLIQAGFFTYSRVMQETADSGKTNAHRLNSFKRSFHNHINILAMKRTKGCIERHMHDFYYPDADREWGELQVALPEEQTISAMIALAPGDVKAVLDLFNTDEGCSQLRNGVTREDGTRETLNEKLCRLTGISPSVDLVDRVKTYFT